MSPDPLLPISPARVKALLLPLGQIKADSFATFADRLYDEHVVHLRDITADGRPNRSMPSPLVLPSSPPMPIRVEMLTSRVHRHVFPVGLP